MKMHRGRIDCTTGSGIARGRGAPVWRCLGRSGLATAALFVFAGLPSAADTLHVAQLGQTPQVPYASWQTAASNVQAAVAAASSHDTVLVSNGVYDAGSTYYEADGQSNLVVISQTGLHLAALSDDPADTLLVGRGPESASSAVRCIRVAASGVIISGFTVTNGHTASTAAFEDGGGIRSTGTDVLVENCVIAGCAAARNGGGVYSSTSSLTISNSVVAGNRALSGGGAYNCIVNGGSIIQGNTAGENGGGLSQGVAQSSVIEGNSAKSGGGAYWVTSTDCVYRGNEAQTYGGGVNCNGLVLSGCVVSNNWSAGHAGGVYYGFITNGCLIADNTATNGVGGGAADSRAWDSTFIGNTVEGPFASGTFFGVGGGMGATSARSIAEAYRCVFIGNRGGNHAGGVYLTGTAGQRLESSLFLRNETAGIGGGVYGNMRPMINCTVVSNVAEGAYSAGVYRMAVTNSIVWGNRLAANGNIANYNSGCAIGHTCASPLPPGIGNIDVDPRFEDAQLEDYRIASRSLCRDAGVLEDWMTGALDLAGVARVQGDGVDLGAYEFDLAMLKGTVIAIR